MQSKISRQSYLGFLLVLLLVSVLFGQFYRLEFFANSSNGLLLADVLVIALGLSFWGYQIKSKEVFQSKLSKPFLVFFAVLLVGFLLNAFTYPLKYQLVGLGYLVRLFCYYSVIFFSAQYFSSVKSKVLWYSFYLVIGLMLLGFLIVKIFPDFTALVALGWDPHQGRLTSTWLDPNYFGNFLACIFAFFLAFRSKFKDRSKAFKIGYLLFLILLWVGIYLTYSRSTLVTFLAAALLVAIFDSWKTVLFVLILFSTSFLIPSRLQSRISDAVNFSVQQTASITQTSTSSVSTTSADPNSSARVNSWKQALKIFAQKPILGTGYNFYGYYKLEQGQLSVAQVEQTRSAAGSDSSFFTLMATTGTLGILAFFWFWFVLIKMLWARRKNAIALGSLGIISGWFIGSFFNNTFLYALMMLPFFILIGIALGPEE